MAKDENKNQSGNVWLRIGRLFIEFVIAAVTAIATSKSASAIGLF